MSASASAHRVTVTETRPREGPGTGELWVLKDALPFSDESSKDIGNPFLCKIVSTVSQSLHCFSQSSLLVPRKKAH